MLILNEFFFALFNKKRKSFLKIKIFIFSNHLPQMSQISLVQFEDENGNRLSEVLQVPNEIELDQLKYLINTQQYLFINGNLIVNSLQNALLTSQLENVEEIKKNSIMPRSAISKAGILLFKRLFWARRTSFSHDVHKGYSCYGWR